MRNAGGSVRTASWPKPAALEGIAVEVAVLAAAHIRKSYGQALAVATKSSSTDVVTQTDLDSELLIRELIELRTPGAGVIGEERGAERSDSTLQWVIDPLDGTVNFLYGLPVFSVSIAVALDSEYVAGAVVDVLRAETFSAHVGGGARRSELGIEPSACTGLDVALVATGFSYNARLRAMQGDIVRDLLPVVRDIRCFGSAALHLCWVAAGRVDAYFERDIKLWDWAAGALIAAESGAELELPCPENEGLVLAATPAVFDHLRSIVTQHSRR